MGSWLSWAYEKTSIVEGYEQNTEHSEERPGMVRDRRVIVREGETSE